MRSILLVFFASTLIPTVAGCSGGSDFEVAADFSGTYDVALTNKENGCNLDRWVVDETTRGIPLVLAQDAAGALSGEVLGGAGLVLSLWLGSNRFQGGKVDGDRGTLTLYGTTTQRQAGCTYTLAARADLRLLGNSVEGTISYTPVTNGSPDCAAIVACRNVQAVAGSRPPR